MRRALVKGGGLLTVAVLLFSTALMPSAFAATTNTSSGTSVAQPTSNPNGAFNVVVSPTSQDMEVKPGGSISSTLQIKNQGLATEHLKITVMKFSATGQSGTPTLLKPGPGDDFVNWAHFSATQFDAQPNVWTKIQMTISPPKTAAFGYYYAIVFSRANSTPAASHPANLIASVATLVLLDVQAPGAVRHADITQFSSTHKIYEFLPATFSIQMHNTGNVHVAPRGNIFITKGGKNIGLLEVNLTQGNVLPNTYRIFTAQWTDGTPSYVQKTVNGKVVLDSSDVPETHLSWNGFSMNKLRFGEYHAQLVMVYNNGENDVSDSASLTFWVIPWRIIIGVLVIVALILAGLWALLGQPVRRRMKTRKTKKNTPSAPQQPRAN